MGEGVRLIDANALKAKIEAAGEDGTIANYCRKVMADCLDNDAPTVEAIPIEWIEWRIAHAELEGFIEIAKMLKTVRDWWNDQRDLWWEEKEREA